MLASMEPKNSEEVKASILSTFKSSQWYKTLCGYKNFDVGEYESELALQFIDSVLDRYAVAFAKSVVPRKIPSTGYNDGGRLEVNKGYNRAIETMLANITRLGEGEK